MATIKPTTAPSKRLSETISASSSSFKVNNIEGWDGNNLTSSDFGTRAWVVFRNSTGTLMEIMEYDPSTIASASITILYRGLHFDGTDQTEVSANKLTWVKGDTIVEFGTHVPQLLAKYVDTIQNQTIAGVKSFSSVPNTTGGDPVDDNDLARKSYVVGLATGSANINRTVVAGTAGETITKDQLIYLKNSDGRWWLCDADTAATVENIVLGIAQGAGTAGGAIASGVLTYGLATFTAITVTANTKYYASNTAGGFSSSAGTTEVTVGYALSTTTMFFNPRFDQVLTEDQQDALAGNSGAPSASNLYVTAKGLQVGAEVYAADAGANDTYVITLSPVPTAYVAGMRLIFKANTINTGTATINVNSLGAKTIVKGVNTTLDDGDIQANQICTIVYDGTNFVLQNPSVVTTGFLSSGAPGTTTTNTTATVLTYALAGGILSTNKGVKIRVSTTIAVNATGNVASYTVAYGGTTIATWAVTHAATPTYTSTIVCDILLMGSGATNTQHASMISTRVLGGSSTSQVAEATQNTASIDSTTSQNITISCTAGSNVTGTLVDYMIHKIV